MQKRTLIGASVIIIATLLFAFFYMSRQTPSNGENGWDTFTQPKNGDNYFTQPKIVYKAALTVDCHVSSSYWERNIVTDLPDYVNTISYSVANIGNSAASNVYLEIKRARINQTHAFG